MKYGDGSAVVNGFSEDGEYFLTYCGGRRILAGPIVWSVGSWLEAKRGGCDEDCVFDLYGGRGGTGGKDTRRRLL